MQEALFYEFSIERHVPADHLLRSIDRFVDMSGLRSHLAADSAYGSAEMLAWLVHERGIEPHIPVFDKSERGDFTCDHRRDLCTCPNGKELRLHQKADQMRALSSTRTD